MTDGGWEVDHQADKARVLATFPEPFRRIFEVRLNGDLLEVVQERFVGIAGHHLVSALAKHHRLLPLDVWLGLAEAICRALAALPPGSGRLVPRSQFFGVDVRRRVVLFRHPDHTLTEEPDRNRNEHMAPEELTGRPLDERSLVFSLATLLVPLLTGDRPFVRENEYSGLEATRDADAQWQAENHPECSAALAGVLTRAMARLPADRPASLEALRVELREAARCVPAPPDRVANVVLGVDPEFVRAVLADLRAQPEFLPASWRSGGLEVLEDSLLESLVSIDRLPLSRAPPPPKPLSRVNLAPQQRAVAPRVNLAPQGVRTPWWQTIWPFRRT